MEYPQHIGLRVVRYDPICVSYILLAPIIIIGGLVVFEYIREYTYSLLIVIMIRFFPEISMLLKPEDVSILFQLFLLSMCSEYINNSKISDTQRWKEGR